MKLTVILVLILVCNGQNVDPGEVEVEPIKQLVIKELVYPEEEVVQEIKPKEQEIRVCGALKDLKTYMPWNAIDYQNSPQYRLQEQYKVEGSLKHLVNDDGIVEIDGHLGVAMGSYYGNVGDKLRIVLSSGQELKVILMDIKHEGCASGDGSNIEFVVDTKLMPLKFKRNNYQSKYQGVLQEVYRYDT